MTAGRLRRALILAITLGAFALYAYRLAAPSLRGDEAFTAIFAQWSVGAIMEALRATEPHPPLYYLLMHGWMAWLGRSELALRWPSFVAGLLLVPLTYTVGRRWAGERVGLWAAALTAMNPFLLWHGQDARMYAILGAAGLASAWFAMRLLAEERAGRGAWLGYVAVTLAAIATHYYALFWVLAENLAFLLGWLRGRRAPCRRWVAAQAALALLTVPWALYVGRFMLGHNKDWLAPLNLWEYGRRLATAFSLGLTIEPRLAWPWLAVFGALCLLGMVLSLRRGGGLIVPAMGRGSDSLLLWSVLWLPIALTVGISLRRPLFDERYLIACAPVYLLFVARGLDWVWERRRWAALALLALLGLGSGYALYGYHYAPQYAKSPDWRGLMDHVAARGLPGDLLILNYPDPTQEYYNAGRVAYALLPSAYPVDVAATLGELSRLAETHPRLWLVPTRADNWDREGWVAGWLDRYADLEATQRFEGLEARLYHTAALYAETLRPVGLDLGGEIRLLGYELRREGERLGGEAVALGSQLTVTLYWQPLAESSEDYTVFVQLLDPTGYLRGQQDSPPFAGDYPTSAWQAGERLVDRYTVQVDPHGPPGTYQLVAGMYRWPSIERLPVTDAAGGAVGDHVPLGQVELVP